MSLIFNAGLGVGKGPWTSTTLFDYWNNPLTYVTVYDVQPIYTQSKYAQCQATPASVKKITAVTQPVTSGIVAGYNYRFTANAYALVGDNLNISVSYKLIGGFLPLSDPTDFVITGTAANYYKYWTAPVNIDPTSVTVSFGTQNLTAGASNTIVLQLANFESLAICLEGDSLIRVGNQTKSEIPIRDVCPGHLVYSAIKNDYVPVIANIMSGPVIRIRKIPKDAFGPGSPHTDLFITGGHRVVVDGIEHKANTLPQALRHKYSTPRNVYTLCTPEHDVILANGLPVTSWGVDDWNEYMSELMPVQKN